MAVVVHPTAIVAKDAALGADVEIGPWVIVGPRVTVGDGSVVGPRAVLERNVKLGARVKVGIGAVVGGDPQDLKFKGEETWAEVGDDTVIREYVTVNRGTSDSFKTTVGARCLLMSYVHLGHDCHVADGVVVASMVALAGHVEIGARAVIGGLTGIMQFLRIGTFAYVGGCAAIRKDIPPYARTDGARILGLNKIGLQRGGMAADTIEALDQAFRLLFRSSLNVSQATQRVRDELPASPEVEGLLAFIDASERGVMV